ncbi:MAG: DUF599 family protein [Roseibium album]|uniref:DUF599 family protein n=1 Tax=Roseibium album TaxID=311410 RepID=A0A0M7ADC6_9HYPH|nr:DUF599 family protein [Roseibium album]MBG6147943.1 putative membrane protein [Labrenzia sp. EL_142]MBG6158425.1 putative membrane protein [Labrenzia sp. EL_162]MBG6165790.1 putative membrane protein [Labrenzia sp. EL_195]MBG6178227.1 putative membrane protein [Labrenzia sp. EL_132]MBG6196562.1 putative membrane protein [Labrenzia sp. EL_159]MBG6202608.1 putative membrane protein [Labrenzia sp. EL_13]MBG6232851.1 putative membrane protein [Labrenzia sp. EL_208]MCR9056665.1 DUF599 family 
MHALSYLDLAAAAWFLVAWFGFSLIVDISPLRTRTLSAVMDEYRRSWMIAMSKREVRIMDTSIMTGLQQGTAFFASTALLAIGGGFALLEATDRIVQITGDLSIPVESSRALWEIKVLGLMLIFAYSFFKFGWAYRLFNYASIVMGAVPEKGNAGENEIRQMAVQAGDLNVLAGRHFNRGQRALFFAIGFLGWFAGPFVFAVTTLAVLLVLLRRQFVSRARVAVLSGQYPSLSPLSKSGE